MPRRLAILSLLLPLATAPWALGSDAATIWSSKVQPLFDAQCVKCHGPLEQKDGLALDNLQAALKGSEDGAVVLPGKPEESPLFQTLVAKADPHMPPKKQLSETERETIREWIVALATAQPEAPAKKHPARSFGSIPEAIDALVAEGWQERGVKPAAPVEDHAWCRRVYLDLAGRIPTAAEAAAFLQAPAASRRAELVDRLLTSPDYAVHLRELWDYFLMSRGRSRDRDRRQQSGWWNFLETAFRENRPWNETVRALLVGRPDTPANRGSSCFLYERKNDYQRIAEAVAPLVYGTKVDCAQCHDHPLTREITGALLGAGHRFQSRQKRGGERRGFGVGHRRLQ
jgi:mono/diheme cytochrome c family protein